MTTTTLKPGIYMATVRGVRDQVVAVSERNEYRTLVMVRSCIGHAMADVTDARPLIVVDLSEDDARHLVAYLQIGVERHPEQLGTVGRAVFTAVADQIEAQTKPLRIEEPGLWGVVRTGLREWVRHHNSDGVSQWITDNGCGRATWNDLVDPTLIREGVGS